MTRALLVFVLLFLYSEAEGHDLWISQGAYKSPIGEWCCGEGDCAVMDDGAVKVTPSGYLFNGIGRIGQGTGQRVEWYKEVVPFSEVQPIAPDGKYWTCRRPDKTRRCVFGPPSGS